MYDPEESDGFDMAYYIGTHMPMVSERMQEFGIQKYEVAKGISDANPAHGREILGDIINFTTVKPKFQISEVESLWLTDGYVHTHDH